MFYWCCFCSSTNTSLYWLCMYHNSKGIGIGIVNNGFHVFFISNASTTFLFTFLEDAIGTLLRLFDSFLRSVNVNIQLFRCSRSTRTLYQSSVWKPSLVLSIRRRVPICVEDGQANCLSYGADDTVSPCPTSTGKDPRRFNTTTTIVCPASNAECSSFAGPSIDMLMDPFIVGKIRWSLASFFIILITTV